MTQIKVDQSIVWHVKVSKELGILAFETTNPLSGNLIYYCSLWNIVSKRRYIFNLVHVDAAKHSYIQMESSQFES